MVERFSRRNEIGYVKLGLISAITAVNLGIDRTSPKDQPQYQSDGRKALDYLANRESLIHKIAPHVLEENEDAIEKAKEKFPTEESLNPLLILLKAYSRLQ